MMLSWITGRCEECTYPVVVTQGQTPTHDYCWYCSNPACSNHNVKEETGDMEKPDWVVMKMGDRITPMRIGK